MIIFIMTGDDKKRRIAIPLEKVYSITQKSATIEIVAQNGGTEILDTEKGTVTMPATTVHKIQYLDEQTAAREMACFYYACYTRSKDLNSAYLFSNIPEQFDPEES